MGQPALIPFQRSPILLAIVRKFLTRVGNEIQIRLGWEYSAADVATGFGC